MSCCFRIIRHLQLNACSDGIRPKRRVIELFKSYRMVCNNLINDQIEATYLHLNKRYPICALFAANLLI